MDYDLCVSRAEDLDVPSWMFWKKRRYVVASLAFFGFFNVYALRVNLSIAIVAMTEVKEIVTENGTTTYVSNELHFIDQRLLVIIICYVKKRMVNYN